MDLFRRVFRGGMKGRDEGERENDMMVREV